MPNSILHMTGRPVLQSLYEQAQDARIGGRQQTGLPRISQHLNSVMATASHCLPKRAASELSERCQGTGLFPRSWLFSRAFLGGLSVGDWVSRTGVGRFREFQWFPGFWGFQGLFLITGERVLMTGEGIWRTAGTAGPAPWRSWLVRTD